jgi:hypothetical protein
MKPENQKMIVRTLCASIEAQVCNAIENADIPNTWDGIELRAYLAFLFERETTKMDLKRKRSYRNDIATRPNL